MATKRTSGASATPEATSAPVINDYEAHINEPAKDVEPLNLETKITIKNIADWQVGFSRRADGIGDVLISNQGVAKISRAEAITQIQSGTRLFCGVDGQGSHATIVILDEPTLREVGFVTDTHSQKVFSDDITRELFNTKNFEEFKRALSDNIVTRAEKRALYLSIKKLKLNDYSKMTFIEKYTGFRF